MMFSISFMNLPLEYPYEDDSIAAARGLIRFGDSSEEFLASLSEWDQDKYQNQWRDSIRSLLGGAQRAVLITTFSSPRIASHLEWWALYRNEGEVVVQNQLLFYDGIENEFDPREAVQFLKERQITDEEGNPISEWNISMSELRDFAKQHDAV